MGATFVMSYPAADWDVVAGQNPRAAAARGQGANPRAALAEWVALADAIVYAGGRILVCDPPKAGEGTPRPTGMPYAADWGALVRRHDAPVFLESPSALAHRASEAAAMRAFFADAGVEVKSLGIEWGGRGDLIQIGPGRYLYIAGARTSTGAAAIIAGELGAVARFVEAKVKPPFTFGDEVAAMLYNKAGDGVLLAHEGGLDDRSVPDLRAAFNKIEVIPVDADDAAAGACTALCVNGTVIVPPGLSTTLRGHLVRRGFLLVEQEMPQLWQRGGGGPHALCNELVGFVIGSGAPDYTRARDRIVKLLDTYPERLG